MFAVSATASSGLAVTFGSQTPSVCTVSGSSVSIVSAGSCIVAANQAGNANYSAAPQVTQTIVVNQAGQTIVFGSVPASIAVGGTASVTASGGASGNPVVLGSATPSICSVSGGTVTGVAAGTCIVTANQSGNANYANASQATRSIQVTSTQDQGSATVAAPPLSEFGLFFMAICLMGAGLLTGRSRSGFQFKGNGSKRTQKCLDAT
ncbi:MAG: hypothetical protein QM741_05975 [Rudaea sp.]|uniref:hypothetical protein n=1 Tax=Rudaea sp. TaxID=2136325 RepID=UPI0039E43C24